MTLKEVLSMYQEHMHQYIKDIAKQCLCDGENNNSFRVFTGTVKDNGTIGAGQEETIIAMKNGLITMDGDVGHIINFGMNEKIFLKMFLTTHFDEFREYNKDWNVIKEWDYIA